jgi:dipicolinate synthase subunit A
MKNKEILVIGGDARQYYMAKKLLEYGYEVVCYGEIFHNPIAGIKQLDSLEEVFEQLGLKDNSVVFPVPVTTDGIYIKGTGETVRLDHICQYMKEKERIYGGNIPANMRATCEMKQGKCRDFMKSERVAILNAVTTAEGAVAEAIMLGKGQLAGSECLVIGYGKCGEILADKLAKLGAKVTVMARRESARAKAVAYGLHACSFELSKISPNRFAYIFNSVPSMIVTKEFLDKCDHMVTIIDIASSPGGVDFACAAQMGITAKLCLGLPGKYAPKTAGEILAEEISKEKEQS